MNIVIEKVLVLSKSNVDVALVPICHELNCRVDAPGRTFREEDDEDEEEEVRLRACPRLLLASRFASPCAL